MNVLKIQNISLSNKVVHLKRQIAELTEKSKKRDQRLENIESNFSLFKICWKRVRFSYIENKIDSTLKK
jgi:hypothetical protein